MVWDAEPVGSGHLVELCREKLGWKKSTTYTVLKKLCEKGVLQNENSTVTSAVLGRRWTIRRRKLCGQGLRRVVAGVSRRFMGGRKLTDREAEDLKRLIDQYKEG